MNTALGENTPVRKMSITKIQDRESFPFSDELAVEEPLEIRVHYRDGEERYEKNIAVTMRTPGHDHELAIGFLFTEGIIHDIRQIKETYHLPATCNRTAENTIIVSFADGIVPEIGKADRNFYTTSSCGVCGKGSISSIRTVSSFSQVDRGAQVLHVNTLYQLPETLRSFQDNFSATGGIHASGLFDLTGNLLAVREDVGRHNALDKLIGHAFSSGQMPLTDKLLLLSGRASFELIQKAAMAGISTVAAIGAPSSLAVDLAKEFDITLLGFLRDHRCNIYHQGSHLTLIDLYENQNQR